MRLSDRIQCCGVVGAALGPAALPPYSPGCRHADQLVSASGPLASIALPMCSRTDSPCYRQYSLLLYRQALHVGDALGTQSLPWGLAWPYSMREDFCFAGVNPGLDAVAGGGVAARSANTRARIWACAHTHTHTPAPLAVASANCGQGSHLHSTIHRTATARHLAVLATRVYLNKAVADRYCADKGRQKQCYLMAVFGCESHGRNRFLSSCTL